MLPYLFLYFIAFVFSFYNYIKENANKIPFFLLMLLVGVFAGSRFKIGGYDYDVYELMYENTSSNLFEALSSKYFLLITTEKGYIILMSLFNALGFDFNEFLLSLGILCSIGLFFVFTRYSKLLYLVVAIFFAKGFLFYFFTAQRQIIAMTICWLAIKFVIKKKLLKFILLVALASFFHTSAITFIILYPISRLKFTNIKVIYLIIGSFLVGVLKIGSAFGIFISQYLPFSADKLNKYLSTGSLGVNILNFVEMVPILLIVLHFRKKIEVKIPHFNIFFNMYILFIMMTFAFYDFDFIARIKGYFVIGYIIILSSLVYIPLKKNVGIGIVFLLLLYCLAVFVRELLVFDNGDGYLPYNSFLLNSF